MTNSNSSQQLESNFPPLLQNDGIYRFLRGKESNLQSLRSYNASTNTSTSTDASMSTNNSTVQNENDEDEDEEREKMIHHMPSASVTIQNSPDAVAATPTAHTRVMGQLLITTKRVFFIAKDEKEIDKDFSIDAQCISLHAMMSEPESSVYCQLSDDCVAAAGGSGGGAYQTDEAEDQASGPVEIFFFPEITTNETKQKTTDIENEKKKELCQTLFESFSQLVNLNPVHDDQDDGTGAGGLAAMLGMIANQYDDDNDDGDMICRIDANQMVTAWDEKSEDGAAPSDERNRMLERLDNMLVVPPEYEVNGQFDDADEDGTNTNGKGDGDEDMNDIL